MDPAVIAFILLVIIALAIGLGVGLSGNKNNGANNGPCNTVNIGEEVRGAGDYVGVVFTACPSEAGFKAFTDAAARWSGIVAANGIAPLNSGANFDVAQFCGLESNVIFNNFDFDHLVVLAETIDIDGVNGVLAAAGPCALDANNLFPLLGAMTFDNADIDSLERQGTLEFVVTHEMGHVLGLGTLWSSKRQGGANTNVNAQRLIQDPVFTFGAGGGVTVNANAQPNFIGTNAIGEFDALLGGVQTTVPVEDGRNAAGQQTFNINNGDGIGSIDGHWKITTFDNELMTFAIDPNERLHPLSRVTIDSLADLGYVVDVNQADDFDITAAAERGSKKNLRSSDLIILGDDILPSFKKFGPRQLPRT